MYDVVLQMLSEDNLYLRRFLIIKKPFHFGRVIIKMKMIKH